MSVKELDVPKSIGVFTLSREGTGDTFQIRICPFSVGGDAPVGSHRSVVINTGPSGRRIC